MTAHIPLFHARARAKALAAELARLQEREERLGLLSVAELEEQKQTLESEVAELETKLTRERSEAVAAVDKEIAEIRERAETSISDLRAQEAELNTRLARLREEVVVTEETTILQEVGIYEYRHPLTDAVGYQSQLRRVQDAIKIMARKDGGAVLASTSWTVNGSLAKGRVMVRDYSKLMLRAYNAEADNLVRGLKPYKLESAIQRLTKAAVMIERLGKTMWRDPVGSVRPV